MTDPIYDDLDFEGSEGAEAAEELAKKNSGGGAFNRVEFFSLDGSEDAKAAGNNSAILRFLSDIATLDKGTDHELPGMISVKQHASVQTKPKPADLGAEARWPKSMSATCRRDRIFARKYNDECYICDHKLMNTQSNKVSRATDRKWAIAVLREEVIGDGSEALGGPDWKGKVVGVRDQMKEVVKTDDEGKPTDETEMVKCYVKVNLGWKNFFSILSGFGSRYGTLLDRDYFISRSGIDTDTTYNIVPNDPVNWAKNKEKRFDLRDPEIRATDYPDMPNLRQIVAETASDDLYNRFFIPEADQKNPSPQEAEAQSSSPAAPSSEAAPPADKEKLAAIRDRVMGGGGKTAEAAPSGGGGGLSL